MTLLEAIVAAAILALVGVACLEGTQRATSLQRRAEVQAQQTQRAESVLDEAVASVAAGRMVQTMRAPASDVRVSVTPYVPTWASREYQLPLQQVAVEVRDPQGRVTRLTRLVESSTP